MRVCVFRILGYTHGVVTETRAAGKTRRDAWDAAAKGRSADQGSCSRIGDTVSTYQYLDCATCGSQTEHAVDPARPGEPNPARCTLCDTERALK